MGGGNGNHVGGWDGETWVYIIQTHLFSDNNKSTVSFTICS